MPTAISLHASRAIVAALLLALAAVPGQAGEPTRISTPADPRAWPVHPLTPTLKFGAWAYTDLDYKGDYDLASSRDDNRFTVDPEVGLGLLYYPNPDLQFYLGLDGIRFSFIDPPAGSASSPLRIKISRVDMVVRDFIDGCSLQVGRQRFKDRREWVVDETMDGLRLHFHRERFAAELSLSQERLFDEDLLNRQERPEINNYLALARYLPRDDIETSIYWLTRDDTSSRAEDRHYVGMQAFGRLLPRVDFWANAAYLTGEGERGKLAGWGLDLGFIYLLDPVSKLSLTTGVAFGTGDDHPEDSVDHRFSQTGIQDNNAKLNGVTSFRYYGELMRPTVSNILITIIGGGFRPTPRSSVDLVYHYYRQHHADTRLDASLLAVPGGTNPDLGHEMDLILGISEIEDWKLELVLGVYVPGRAFAGEDNAYFGSFELSYDY